MLQIPDAHFFQFNRHPFMAVLRSSVREFQFLFTRKPTLAAESIDSRIEDLMHLQLPVRHLTGYCQNRFANLHVLYPQLQNNGSGYRLSLLEYPDKYRRLWCR